MAKGKYYKHKEYGHVYGNPLPTPSGRAAWPALVNPKPPPPPKPGQKPGNPRFEVTIVLPKNDATKNWLRAVKTMTDEMLEVFNEGRPAQLANVTVAKDGNKFDLEKYPYYKDQIVITARNEKRPPVVDAQKQELAPEAIKGGNIIACTVTPLITASGISYKLNAVMLRKDDGVYFGGGIDTQAFLDILPEGEDNGDAPKQTKSSTKGKDAVLDML